MKRSLRLILCGVLHLGAAGVLPVLAQEPVIPSAPEFWKWAAKPPMGWNSYDSFGDSVTEEEILANARYMKEHLLSHGWNYIVVDYRWYDPGAHSSHLKDRVGAALAADEFGRLLPAPNRFPSTAESKSFKPLADQIHAMGLKFGIHVMRGIPRQSVAAKTPIEKSEFKANDAANVASTCTWCPDMFGVDASTTAGQAWYDSIMRQYAQWEVDYLKIDDLARPYSLLEIEAIRKAIDKTGRPMALSLSPGETPVGQATHVMRQANLWRMADDLWDQWRFINHTFDLLARWQDIGGPGHWPDADMIPLGMLAKRCTIGGKERSTRLTKDEQITLMSLWALAPSPLMLGMNLPENDEWTNSLLINDAVLAVNQDALGKAGVRISANGETEVWMKELANGAKAVGLFNRGSEGAEMAVSWKDAGLTGKQTARDLWKGEAAGSFDEKTSFPVPSHGAVLLELKKATE